MLVISKIYNRVLINHLRIGKKIGDGYLSIQIKDIATRKDELGQLATSFNQMTQNLEQNLTAQQQLLCDISHELSSPMTRLQMALGLAQQKPLTAADLTKYWQRCDLEVERLNSMIGDTLVLSRVKTLYNLLM